MLGQCEHKKQCSLGDAYWLVDHFLAGFAYRLWTVFQMFKCSNYCISKPVTASWVCGKVSRDGYHQFLFYPMWAFFSNDKEVKSVPLTLNSDWSFDLLSPKESNRSDGLASSWTSLKEAWHHLLLLRKASHYAMKKLSLTFEERSCVEIPRYTHRVKHSWTFQPCPAQTNPGQLSLDVVQWVTLAYAKWSKRTTQLN